MIITKESYDMLDSFVLSRLPVAMFNERSAHILNKIKMNYFQTFTFEKHYEIKHFIDKETTIISLIYRGKTVDSIYLFHGNGVEWKWLEG